MRTLTIEESLFANDLFMVLDELLHPGRTYGVARNMINDAYGKGLITAYEFSTLMIEFYCEEPLNLIDMINHLPPYVVFSANSPDDIILVHCPDGSDALMTYEQYEESIGLREKKYGYPDYDEEVDGPILND